jgi:carbamate kinase
VVPCVYRRYRKSNHLAVRELSAAEAEELLPELPEGSMRPKLEAAAAFARVGGETLITSSTALADALEGRNGTIIHR